MSIRLRVQYLAILIFSTAVMGTIFGVAIFLSEVLAK
jgi:hypothetical protein